MSVSELMDWVPFILSVVHWNDRRNQLSQLTLLAEALRYGMFRLDCSTVKGEGVTRHVVDFHGPLGHLGDVRLVPTVLSESDVGGRDAGALDTFDHGAGLVEDGKFTLAGYRAVQPAVGAELHTVGSDEFGRHFAGENVAEELAFRFAHRGVVAVDRAADRFVDVEQAVRAESETVGEPESVVQAGDREGVGVDAVHTPVVGVVLPNRQQRRLSR